jgi:hypothetical protein
METEVEEMTLAFRGLSDDSDRDPGDEEVSGGGLDGGAKQKVDGDEDPLLEPGDDPLDSDKEDEDDDGLSDDGTPDM